MPPSVHDGKNAEANAMPQQLTDNSGDAPERPGNDGDSTAENADSSDGYSDAGSDGVSDGGD
ncbi:hypothetical protein N7G274_000349 [Stereocaulon virgatum]|uniref:Uncharacterized protein n=1 Tax=Stereocaulon virgatum TaxID=373712 RepID=A0ABR4AU89_9LECA